MLAGIPLYCFIADASETCGRIKCTLRACFGLRAPGWDYCCLQSQMEAIKVSISMK